MRVQIHFLFNALTIFSVENKPNFKAVLAWIINHLLIREEVLVTTKLPLRFIKLTGNFSEGRLRTILI
jgi:hypothetical protein